MFRRSIVITMFACALIGIAPGCDRSKADAVKPAFNVDEMAPEQRIFELIRQGDLAQVKELATSNPQVLTIPEAGGMTVLHVAAAEGKADIAQFLVESGCDVTAPDDFGQTPIDIAKTGGQTAVLKVLEGGGGGQAQ